MRPLSDVATTNILMFRVRICQDLGKWLKPNLDPQSREKLWEFQECYRLKGLYRTLPIWTSLASLIYTDGRLMQKNVQAKGRSNFKNLSHEEDRLIWRPEGVHSHGFQLYVATRIPASSTNATLLYTAYQNLERIPECPRLVNGLYPTPNTWSKPPPARHVRAWMTPWAITHDYWPELRRRTPQTDPFSSWRPCPYHKVCTLLHNNSWPTPWAKGTPF